MASILDFEGFNLRKMLRAIQDDPERLLTGVGPAGTALGNLLSRDDKTPLVTFLGRPDPSTFREAEAQGIDTRQASALHDIAEVIASIYGLRGLKGLKGDSQLPVGLPNLQSQTRTVQPSVFVASQPPELLPAPTDPRKRALIELLLRS